MNNHDDGFILVSKRKTKKKTSSIELVKKNEIYERSYDKKEKKILCKQIIETKSCPYGNGCRFAHSLEEQNVDTIRKRVYSIINGKELLDDIDLVHDIELFETFRTLTRTCFRCGNHTCLGGYNCKNGAIDLQHTICNDDLIYGRCRQEGCRKIHLTTRNLIPYNVQKLIYNGNITNKQEYFNTLINHIPRQFDIKTILTPHYVPDLESIGSLSEDEKSNESCNEYIITLQ